MAKQVPNTDKGRDTVQDQTRFQHVSTQKTKQAFPSNDNCAKH